MGGKGVRGEWGGGGGGGKSSVQSDLHVNTYCKDSLNCDHRQDLDWFSSRLQPLTTLVFSL